MLPLLFSALLENANTFLVVLSFVLHIPDEHTAVPAAAEGPTCRIFSGALWQQDCGSCAAFAAATLAAMRACLWRKEDVVPSPFRIFDCSNSTCDEGMDVAHAAAIIDFGVGDIDASPQRYGLQCDLRWEARPPEPLRVTHKRILRTKEIRAAILFAGPVLGSMFQTTWRDGETGVYHSLIQQHPLLSSSQQPSSMRHAIVVVGWDRDGNWIVQNSWGEEWGDGHGRGRIAPNVLAHAIDPTIHLMLRICTCALTACVSGLLLCFVSERCGASSRAVP